jgi:hypothetical protein
MVASGSPYNAQTGELLSKYHASFLLYDHNCRLTPQEVSFYSLLQAKYMRCCADCRRSNGQSLFSRQKKKGGERMTFTALIILYWR